MFYQENSRWKVKHFLSVQAWSLFLLCGSFVQKSLYAKFLLTYNYACDYVLQKFCLAMLAWCMTCLLIFFVEITILEPVLIRYLAFRTPALFVNKCLTMMHDIFHPSFFSLWQHWHISTLHSCAHFESSWKAN